MGSKGTKFTPLEIKVLRAAKDSVRLEIIGLDKYPGSNGHWYRVCLKLAAGGLLQWHPTNRVAVDSWKLTDAGKQALAELDGNA